MREGLRKECAWCGALLDPGDPGASPTQSTTHGICLRCKHRLLAEYKATLRTRAADVERLHAAVVAEREACASIADEVAAYIANASRWGDGEFVASDIAVAIRARGA